MTPAHACSSSPTAGPVAAAAGATAPDQAATPGRALSEVSRELERLSRAATEDGLLEHDGKAAQHKFQNRLVHSRLGSAAGMYAALRAKHPPTANHCLRVALTCSGWAATAKLSDDDRETLEVAALLHDLGKIGVPDNVLCKPGRLQPEEQSAMAWHRQFAVEMLTSSGAPQAVIDTVLTAAAWYDGSHVEVPLSGEQIPATARMLAIADAFDSMTTDHVYRPARPLERAIAELFTFAGRQFDPHLVRAFSEFAARSQQRLTEEVTNRWLAELSSTAREGWTAIGSPANSCRPGNRRQAASHSLFEQKLVDNMHDGVVFVDSQSRIFVWNTGAERLTGIAAGAACDRIFEPSLLQLTGSDGGRIHDSDCPIQRSIRYGVQTLERVGMRGRSGREVTVDLQVVPVYDNLGAPCGATILLQDVSSETSLEERCQALHIQTTRDPLTQVANRAEFDRMLELFIEVHQETDLTCSLIMADIDYFKQINDTHGHQAGDEAIITFASLLKSMCRSGDLVARYGGEEFAILCADCNNATAAARAEQIRQKLSETKHPSLGNHAITASFGVTELQAGDTPEIMLRRADRALLQAKDQGRNQVIQLGNGMIEKVRKSRWFSFKPWTGGDLIDTRLVTNVPIALAVEKLRGFISDRGARILEVTEKEVRLELSEVASGRKGDSHPISFVVDIQLDQQRQVKENTAGLAAGEYVQTVADGKIRPKRDRDRRKGLMAEQARLLLGSLKSYLMARETTAEPVAG